MDDAKEGGRPMTGAHEGTMNGNEQYLLECKEK
jgi:hypothetical protein